MSFTQGMEKTTLPPMHEPKYDTVRVVVVGEKMQCKACIITVVCHYYRMSIQAYPEKSIARVRWPVRAARQPTLATVARDAV